MYFLRLKQKKLLGGVSFAFLPYTRSRKKASHSTVMIYFVELLSHCMTVVVVYACPFYAKPEY